MQSGLLVCLKTSPLLIGDAVIGVFNLNNIKRLCLTCCNIKVSKKSFLLNNI